MTETQQEEEAPPTIRLARPGENGNGKSPAFSKPGDHDEKVVEVEAKHVLLFLLGLASVGLLIGVGTYWARSHFHRSATAEVTHAVAHLLEASMPLWMVLSGVPLETLPVKQGAPPAR